MVISPTKTKRLCRDLSKALVILSEHGDRSAVDDFVSKLSRDMAAAEHTLTDTDRMVVNLLTWIAHGDAYVVNAVLRADAERLL